MSCIFCRIAAREVNAVTLHEDDQVLAFLDTAPVRPGHALIIPKQHVETFEQLPPELAARMLSLGQQLGRRLRQVYGVERVAFFFTGTDIPHAHAHVLPMHEKTDVTSARYITTPGPVEFGSRHLAVERPELLAVRDKLAFSFRSP